MTDGQTDIHNFRGYNRIPSPLFVVGHKENTKASHKHHLIKILHISFFLSVPLV